uniref:Uncharacterized protein n=1 Tax=Siphoviridae sp. ctrG012 TaxID=2826475 RepID=A0A8S5MA38_9CAUD|nr:MAG TPA: hypothetical protein [Siphoviridae sp. ctrG012]
MQLVCPLISSPVTRMITAFLPIKQTSRTPQAKSGGWFWEVLFTRYVLLTSACGSPIDTSKASCMTPFLQASESKYPAVA